jgi:ferredoxin
MLLRYDRLPELLQSLSAEKRVYVPSASAGMSRFALYGGGVEPDFELVNTTMPPKDLLFPQTQKMYRYGFDGEGLPFIDSLHDADEVVLFGIRSCDARSIECMDDVFLTRGFVDEFYQARRERLTTVAIGCTQVAESCFCDSMGLDANTAPSADLQLTAAGDGYEVRAQTERGAAALEAWKPYLTEGAEGTAAPASAPGSASAPAPATTAPPAPGSTPGSASAPAPATTAPPAPGSTPGSASAPAPATTAPPASATATQCTLKVDMTGIKEKLDSMFEHPLWDDISKKCITCGTCTYVCPTCHCFDISQDNRMQEGERFRCWDSCMFSAYTEMAGNHNPRAEKMPRVRQRFMHKLCFFEERYGKSLCVGCGRCVEKCPVALDITVLIDQIGAADLGAAAQTAEGGSHVTD